MPDFGLDEDDVRWTLSRVHWGQTGFMLFVGTLLAVVPQSRFGNSYRFIVQAPGGQYNVSAVFLVVGLFMWWSLRRGNQRGMSRALFVAALANLFFGVSLGIGALFGPTGVIGAPYTLYVAWHMFTQSELLGRRR